MTKFERAYIELYNDIITLQQFAQAAGIPDEAEAMRQLLEYREKVLDGVISDPRDTHNRWRRDIWKF